MSREDMIFNERKACDKVLCEWHTRLLEGEIFIADDNTYESDVLDKRSIIESGIKLFAGSEGFRESNILVGVKEYVSENEEFTVYYPVSRGEDIHFADVEIVTDVASFIKKVVEFENKKGHKIFYRGHNNWEYHLEPGIYRKGKESFIQGESEYIRDVITTYPKYFTECKTALDYLSVMQHYGFPTRLLDFSENPLIALFMACDGEGEKQADVIRVSIPNENFKFYDSDTVSMLSNIAFVDDIQHLANQIHNEKPHFERKINLEDLEKIVFVKAKQSFDRISHQSGVFALFGIRQEKGKAPIFELMKPLCEITHFIIPAEFKQKIMRELSHLNITRASVYCDLGNVAKHYIEMNWQR